MQGIKRVMPQRRHLLKLPPHPKPLLLKVVQLAREQAILVASNEEVLTQDVELVNILE